MNPTAKTRRTTQVTVEVNDALTPEVFSLMVEKIIAYIAFNTNQMPVNFDILRGLMKRRRTRMNELAVTEELSGVYRELECGGRYNAIEQIYDSYEATFTNIQKELANEQGVQEIVIVVGLPLMPKHIYLISVPKLTYSHPNPSGNARRALCQLFRNLIPTLIFNPVERNMLETFVYLGLRNPSTFNSDWFTPKRFFLHNTTPLTTIDFLIKSDFVDNVASGVRSFHIHEDASVNCSTDDDIEMNESEGDKAQPNKVSGDKNDDLSTTTFRTEDTNWFGGKQGLRGFRDGRINGELLLGRLERLLNQSM